MIITETQVPAVIDWDRPDWGGHVAVSGSYLGAESK